MIRMKQSRARRGIQTLLLASSLALAGTPALAQENTRDVIFVGNNWSVCSYFSYILRNITACVKRFLMDIHLHQPSFSV